MKLLCALIGIAATVLAVLALVTASAGFFGFLIKLASVLILAFAALGGLGLAAKPPSNSGMALVGVLLVTGLGILLIVMTPRPGLADQTPARIAATPADDVPVPHIGIEKPRKTSAKEADTVNLGHVLGHWITPLPPTSAQFLTIRERDGVYEVVLQLFHSRNPIVSQLRARRSRKGRRFDAVGDVEGTYYILLKNGDLDIWDQDGEFLVARRYDGPTDSASRERAMGALWDWAACRNDASCEGDKYRMDVVQVCPDLIERQARYEVRWTNHLFESRFLPIVQWHGKDGRKKGLIDFAGDKVQVQNGFGAWQNYYYICTFDISTKQIVDLKLRSGRLVY